MPVNRVSADEARRLVESEGYVYLDVRSVPEFDESHASASFNVPILHAAPGGMTPNPDFLQVVRANFDKDAKFVVGCRSGHRSQRACAELLDAGYTNLVDLRPGFDGARDPFGRITEPGWSRAGCPTASGPDAARGYAALRNKTLG